MNAVRKMQDMNHWRSRRIELRVNIAQTEINTFTEKTHNRVKFQQRQGSLKRTPKNGFLS